MGVPTCAARAPRRTSPRRFNTTNAREKALSSTKSRAVTAARRFAAASAPAWDRTAGMRHKAQLGRAA